MSTDDIHSPIHPGEILLADFLEPAGITQNRLANQIGVPPRRINEIVHGKRAITADTALRLSKAFNNSAQFWLTLQDQYELDIATDKLGDTLNQITPIVAA
ncbi:MAG: HigA family addiction module antitoxin [Rhodococcus qingshengii]|jgi:addiction module HigA family antidote